MAWKKPVAEFTAVEVIAAAIIKFDKQQKDDQYNESIDSILRTADNLDFAKAQDVIDTVVSNHTLKLLKGAKIGQFVNDLVAALQIKDLVPPHRYNLMAFAPKVYADITRENANLEAVMGSEFVGELGKTITVSLKIIKCRYVQSHNFFAATAIDEKGNMYNFSPKQQLALTDDFSYNVKAKVKKHDIDLYNNNAKVTYLNYVKVVNANS